MKAIVCEMCGSQELVKKDGMYICQNCGTKYDPEEAKKLMIEVSGSIKVDNTEILENYYQLARRAKENNNAEDAIKYYGLIQNENPDDWEAYFYTIYYRALSTTIANIESAANSVNNCLETTYKLIQSQIDDEEKQKEVLEEVSMATMIVADKLFDGARDSFLGISIDNRGDYLPTCANRVFATINILVTECIKIREVFGDKNWAVRRCEAACNGGSRLCWNAKPLFCWGPLSTQRFYSTKADEFEGLLQKAKESLPPKTDEDVIEELRMLGLSEDEIKKALEETQMEDAKKTPSNTTKKTGCYVATAVYGSYDCPQVWTLRRYRDYFLAETWYGRAFIHAYYAVSPVLVKWFGKTEWFKILWKPTLNRMVEKLRQEGVEDTPYHDQEW